MFTISIMKIVIILQKFLTYTFQLENYTQVVQFIISSPLTAKHQENKQLVVTAKQTNKKNPPPQKKQSPMKREYQF